jgi:putative DNA primase/helicase
MVSNKINKSQAPAISITDNLNQFFTGMMQHEAISHDEVLERLLSQVVRIDFLLLAYPELESIRAKITKLTSEVTLDDGSLDTSPMNKPKIDELSELKERERKCKLTKEAIIVTSIETLIGIAKLSQWNMCKQGDFIYVYNGEFWKVIEKDDLKKFLGKAGEKMGIPRFNARYCKYKDLLLDQFISEAHMPSPVPCRDKVLINLKNGTFEIDPINGNILRQFDADDFLKYQLPFSYEPHAQFPLFTKYIERVLPCIETRNVLSEYLGYIFIRHGSTSLKLEKVLLLYGSGANGKSVLFEILNALLGPENVSNFSLSSLTTEQNGYYRAMINNKLLNYASEINGKMESSIFKQIASGEPLSARLPYGNPMIITEYAKLIFNINELPQEVEHTNAFFRRFLIIPFDVTIPEAEQDRQLHRKIIENELSGVFNWMLEGLERLIYQRHFTHSSEVDKAIEAFKKESDTVHMFLDENYYKPSSTSHEPLKSLYSDYRSSCFSNGSHPVGIKNFSKRLKSIGYTVSRVNIGMIVYCIKE